MKTQAKKYKILLLAALMMAGGLAAQESGPGEIKKLYNKSYAVTGSDRITLNNQFGDMKINTWDKNEVRVEVTMSANADTRERAAEILDRIGIEDGKTSGGVYFKTNFRDEKSKGSGKKKEGFQIDYVAYVPSGNPLDITNRFGSITMGDYNGAQLTLLCKFGSLTAGSLANAKRVTVEFGKAAIGGIRNGDLVLKYSRGLVNNLGGSIDGYFEFCSGVKMTIDNHVKDLTIHNKYTQLYLDLDKTLSASFDVNTHYCKLRNESNYDLKREANDDHRGPVFDNQYKGKTGTGDLLLKIQSEFGDVTMGYNLYFDINEKGEKKKVKI